MSQTHETECALALREHAHQRTLAHIHSRACPFCGQRDWFIHGPIIGLGAGWIVGCQSVYCDSSWRIMRDNLNDIFAMLLHADMGQPK